MKQTLNLKLSQQLTLTPQLKQSLRLLQLPSQDLEHEIQQLLESNPLLERVERTTETVEEIQEISTAKDNDIPQPVSEAADPGYELERTDDLSPEQDLSINWQESLEPARAVSTPTGASQSDTEFTQYVSKQESLFEHLDWQVQMAPLSEQDTMIARAILRCIDEDGYLNASLAELCAMLAPAIDVEEDEVNAVLSLIKTLDPIGVGTYNLGERLMLLLGHHYGDAEGVELAKTIVTQHIDLLGQHNLAKLKRALGVDDERLSRSLALITQLNPRIGAEFKSDNENYITPDVIVSKTEGLWQAKINPDNQAKLRLNKTYTDLLNSKIDDEGAEYIQQNLNDAKMVIKGLMSRYDTLLLVSQAIVKRQHGFFEHGEQAMQPMVLQDIAEQLEMHESTISRATSGKYLLSPRGVHELKYFFSSALSSTDGTASSSTAIRSLIKELVDAESKAKPLSDNKIAKELEQQGHIVARRTVAKYRESMHIAPSSQRKSLI